MPVDELLIEYRSVLGFPNYRVGDDGSVWSKSRNTKNAAETDGWHLLTGGLDKDGYRKVILCKDGQRHYARVSVLVLQAFKGMPPAGMDNPTAAHDNGIKTDNRIGNLFWKSQKENIADKVRHGTAQVGEKHPQSILTRRNVKAIRKRRSKGEPIVSIARDYPKVKPVTVYAVCAGLNWKDVE